MNRGALLSCFPLWEEALDSDSRNRQPKVLRYLKETPPCSEVQQWMHRPSCPRLLQ